MKSFYEFVNENQVDSLNEAMSDEKKEFKSILSKIKKAEDKLIKDYESLRDLYYQYNSKIEKYASWQSTPVGNQVHIGDSLINMIYSKRDFYNKKLNEME